MKIVLLTNDNFFSFTVLKPFLEKYKRDIDLVIFSSALIGKKGTLASIKWSIEKTGLRHTVFKLSVYGVFRLMKLLCGFFSFIKNGYSSHLWVRNNDLEYLYTENVNGQEIIDEINSTISHVKIAKLREDKPEEEE